MNFNKIIEDNFIYECIEYGEDKYWYLNSLFHREDGPAVEGACGSKWWYKHGVPHREDGPAVDLFNGKKYWYLNGVQYSKEVFNRVKGMS